jgi:hypothetical protein
MMIRDAVDGDLGVLVIRVWLEPDADNPFRARLIYGDADEEAATTAVTTRPDEVLDAVRRWLDEHSPTGT